MPLEYAVIIFKFRLPLSDHEEDQTFFVKLLFQIWKISFDVKADAHLVGDHFYFFAAKGHLNLFKLIIIWVHQRHLKLHFYFIDQFGDSKIRSPNEMLFAEVT